MPTILAQAPEARLALIGSGPYEQPLRDLAEKLHVAERVSIRGFGPDERAEMGALIADADVMCLLSEYEAHPISVMEAIGAGTNALVADTSGLTELGTAGLATTIPLDASPEQVAAAALAVAAAPPAMPPNLPDWDDCSDRLLNLYHEVR
jgi:glycosyltransferase involved in cell wall biosynthesis